MPNPAPTPRSVSNLHLETYPSDSEGCQSFALAGWSIEWRASGILWRAWAIDAEGFYPLGWDLFNRDGCLGWVSVEVVGYRACWCWPFEILCTGTLTDCARALVERVRR
jgi:hypothetical protein